MRPVGLMADRTRSPGGRTCRKITKAFGEVMHQDRRTLVIISQTFVPDPASVGQHIADVAQEMARRGHRVVVYTSNRGYENPGLRYPSRKNLNGVDVRRLPFSSFGKRSIAV